MLETTLTLVNSHFRVKSQPCELIKKNETLTSNIPSFEDDWWVVLIPSHWKKAECWLYCFSNRFDRFSGLLRFALNSLFLWGEASKT